MVADEEPFAGNALDGGEDIGGGQELAAILGRVGGDGLRRAIVPDPDIAAAQGLFGIPLGAPDAGFAEGMAEGAQGGVAIEGGAGLALGFGEFGRRGVPVEIHGVEDAEKVGGQVEAGEVGAAFGWRRDLGVARARLRSRNRMLQGVAAPSGFALEADVLVAEVAVEKAGVVHGADGFGDALEKVHEGGAAGRAGVDAMEFVAEAGEIGHEGRDEAAFAEPESFPSFGDGDGGGSADAGGAEGERVAEGAFGLAAVVGGEPVAPGGLEAIGLDDGVERFIRRRAGRGGPRGGGRAEREGWNSFRRERRVGRGFRRSREDPGRGREEAATGRAAARKGQSWVGGAAFLGRRCSIHSSRSLAYLTKTAKAVMRAMMNPWRPSRNPRLKK